MRRDVARGFGGLQQIGVTVMGASLLATVATPAHGAGKESDAGAHKTQGEGGDGHE